MPMLDIQEAHLEVFRLRFGDRTDKGAPRRLLQPRITSTNPAIVDGFCGVYGGDRREWGATQWEAYLPTRTIRILLIPGQSLSQWWEMYKGSVCVRRCDGVTEEKSGKSCMCPTKDPAKRNANQNECTSTTRISFMCPDVPVVGAGSLVTHGLVAAQTLPQSVAAANAALAAGMYVPATLSVIEVVGQGKKYIVPKIEVVGTSLEQLMLTAAEWRDQNGGVLDGSAQKILGFTPPAPAQLEAGSAGSLRDQFDTNSEPAKPFTGKRAQEPIPPTGLAPRPADEVMDAESWDDDEGGDEVGSGTSQGPPPSAGTRTVNRVAIAAREAGLDDDGRHYLCSWASSGRVLSSKELTDDETEWAIAGANLIKTGRADLRAVHVDGEKSSIGLFSTKFGWPIPPASVHDTIEREDADNDPEAPATADTLTADQIGKMKAPELIAALKAKGTPPQGAKKLEELRALVMEAYEVGDESF